MDTLYWKTSNSFAAALPLACHSPQLPIKLGRIYGPLLAHSPFPLVTPHFGFTLNPSSQQMSKKVTPRLWPLSPLISVALLERTCLALIAFRCCCGRVRLLCVTPLLLSLTREKWHYIGGHAPAFHLTCTFFPIAPRSASWKSQKQMKIHLPGEKCQWVKRAFSISLSTPFPFPYSFSSHII